MVGRMIITDLDHTLLRDDKCISAYTVSVLSRCRDAGMFVAFATARSERAMVRFIQAIQPDAIISNGGATIRVQGRLIHQNLLPQEDVVTILGMCQQFTAGRGLITVESEDGYYCNFVPTDPDRRAAFIYSDFADFRKPAYKITAELETEWGEAIARACNDCRVVSFSREKWRRFAAEGADKGTALRVLCENMGIDPAHVIAFGDDWNDLGMLELAGTAVAVSNAIEEVKDVADHITDSNDHDGVARFLEGVMCG